MNTLHMLSMRVYGIQGKGWTLIGISGQKWLLPHEKERKLRGLNMLKSVYRGEKVTQKSGKASTVH